MQKTLLLGLVFLVWLNPLLAQGIQVIGTVKDAEGLALPGVNVVLKGTTRGVATGQDGSYTMLVDGPESVLVFTFLGFISKEELVGARTRIDVQLQEDITTLGEVVVTALGIERDKKSLGFSSQSVAGDELTTARESNVINSLSGRVSGVQINQSGTGPGGTSKVVIRGYSSIAGNNSPLYVIDGVPMTNSQGGGGQFGGIDFGDGISNISPDDVESINVLKGAAATALYGSRGQNGVIMITTKKGKARKGVGVELNTNATFDSVLVLPEFQDRFGRGSNGNFPVDANGNFSNVTRTSWGERMRGQTEVNGIPLLNWTGEPTSYSPQPDNIRDFFRTGVTRTNSIGLTAGDDKTQGRLSLTHLNRDNIMPNSDFERISINLNLRSKLSEKLTVEGKINYIKQTAFNRPNLTLSPDNPMASLIEMPRSIRLDDLKDFQTPEGFPRVYTNAPAPDQWQNPYWAVNLNTNNDDRDRIIGYMLMEYQLTDWLKVHLRTGTDFFNDFRQNRSATNTIYRVSPDRSFYSLFYGRTEERNSDFLFTASRNLSERVNFSANFGGNMLQLQSRGITNTAQGLNIPNFFVMQNALSVVTSESRGIKKVNSLYGSAQFDYNNYLFVEASARNDWSSALPAASRSYFYPSVSSSFVFTEALDYGWGPLTFGKLRGSWSQVGNDTGPHQLDLNYVVNALTHGGQNFGQLVNILPPVNLRPERTTSVEAGVELGFFQNRLQVDFTYYHAGTVDQILRIPVSRASGYTTAIVNAGLVTNNGVELSLRGTPIKTANFTYESYLNFTRNRSFVKELAPNVDVYQLGGTYDQFGVRIQAEVGRPFGDIYADRAYLRDPDTGQRIIGANGLPIPDPAGIKRIGNFQPDFLAGYGHVFRYKNISMSMLFDMRKGGDIFSFSNAVAAANGNAKYTQYDRLEWYAGAGGYVASGITENGQPNTVEVNPQSYWQYVGGRASTFAEEFLYDGSFVKFREFTLGYRLPRKFIQNTFLQSVDVSFVGRNLFILHSNTPGFDPEATFNAGNDQGIEAFAFPSTRSLGFNLKLTL
jgi:TonB-linked SusC/RagA family outer membrane protein